MKVEMKMVSGAAVLMALVVMSSVLCVSAVAAADFTSSTNSGTGVSPNDGMTPNGDQNNVTAEDYKTNARYTYATSRIVSEGMLRAVSGAPILLLGNTENRDIYFSEMHVGLWYCSNVDNMSTEPLDLYARAFGSSDLDNMDVAVIFPNGNVSYAKNFKIAQVNGKWQVEAEHGGFPYVKIMDQTGGNDTWFEWKNKTIVLPDNVQGKPFAIKMETF